MNKQLWYILVGIVSFFILMAALGYLEMGGDSKPQIVNPQLLKEQIEREKNE